MAGPPPSFTLRKVSASGIEAIAPGADDDEREEAAGLPGAQQLLVRPVRLRLNGGSVGDMEDVGGFLGSISRLFRN